MEREKKRAAPVAFERPTAAPAPTIRTTTTIPTFTISAARIPHHKFQPISSKLSVRNYGIFERLLRAMHGLWTLEFLKELCREAEDD